MDPQSNNWATPPSLAQRVVYMYMDVLVLLCAPVCSCMCRSQRSTSGVFLNHSLNLSKIMHISQLHEPLLSRKVQAGTLPRFLLSPQTRPQSNFNLLLKFFTGRQCYPSAVHWCKIKSPPQSRWRSLSGKHDWLENEPQGCPTQINCSQVWMAPPRFLSIVRVL